MSKKPLRKEDANRIVVTSGWFHGLNKIIIEYGLTADEIAKIKVQLFKLILTKVIEAKQEIAKLQIVINRMEATCRDGTRPKPWEGLEAYGANVWRLREEMKALDGWTISLLESDMSLLAAIENPETMGERVISLRQSFSELWSLRVDAGFRPMMNFPDVFDVESTSIP